MLCDMCDYHTNLFFFFFKISNLLHEVYRQTMVATFVTTYNTKLHGKENEK